MRLRSSQIVFLLLLLCSVPLADAHALQCFPAHFGQTEQVTADRSGSRAAQRLPSFRARRTLARSQASRLTASQPLDAALRHSPQHQAASVMVHTGYLRG